MLKTRKLLLLTAVTATALALSGCASGMPGTDMGDSNAPAASASATAADFNGADVIFAQMMIPHHEQAIEMSDVLLAKADIDDRIRELAEQIKAAQQPEIDQLREWLDEWGEEESGMGGMGGMNHGGMMTEEDMTALEGATGTDAARLFLEQMTMHHEGAVEMAQAEVEDGQNEDAKAMAETIVATQTGEITTMQKLLESL